MDDFVTIRYLVYHPLHHDLMWEILSDVVVLQDGSLQRLFLAPNASNRVDDLHDRVLTDSSLGPSTGIPTAVTVPLTATLSSENEDPIISLVGEPNEALPSDA